MPYYTFSDSIQASDNIWASFFGYLQTLVIINRFIFAYSMSEKVIATFVVIYPISHEVLHISMYMLLLLLPSRFSRVWLCETPYTATHQAPLSLGFSRQEYWSGLLFPSPMHACMLSRFSSVWLCATPWTAAHQAPPSTGFSRQDTLLANYTFFMKDAFLFSVHFPSELLPFPWFTDTPYIITIFLLFILYIANILFQVVTFIFVYGITHQKEVSYVYIFKSVSLSIFGFCFSISLKVFPTKNSKNSLLYFLLVLLFLLFFVRRYIPIFYFKSYIKREFWLIKYICIYLSSIFLMFPTTDNQLY